MQKKREETTPKHTVREATVKRIWRKKEAKKNNTNTHIYSRAYTPNDREKKDKENEKTK